MISDRSSIYDREGNFLLTLGKSNLVPIESNGKLKEFEIRNAEQFSNKRISRFSGILIGKISSLVFYKEYHFVPKDIYDTCKDEIEKNTDPQILGSGRFGIVSKIYPECIIVKKFFNDSVTRGQIMEVYIQSLFKGCSCTPQLLMIDYGAIYSTYGGTSFYDYIEKREFTLQEIRDKLKALISCLNLYSKQDITHGDLKPDNLLIHPNGKIMIVDWGMSLKSSAKYKPLAQGDIMYAAPELLGAAYWEYDKIDYKIDIFSLSQIMCDILGESFEINRMNRLSVDIQEEDYHRLRGDQSRVNYKTALKYYSDILPKNLDKYMLTNNTFTENKENKESKKLLSEYIDLIKKCSKVNPKKRYSYEDILNHPFFKDSPPSITDTCILKELSISDLHPSPDQLEILKEGYLCIDQRITKYDNKKIYYKESLNLDDFFFKCCDTLTMVLVSLNIDLPIQCICDNVIYIVSCLIGARKIYPDIRCTCLIDILSLGSNILLKTKTNVTKKMYLNTPENLFN